MGNPGRLQRTVLFFNASSGRLCVSVLTVTKLIPDGRVCERDEHLSLHSDFAFGVVVQFEAHVVWNY